MAATGRGRWHPDDAEAFDYVELEVDSISDLPAAHVSRAVLVGNAPGSGTSHVVFDV